MKEKFLFSQISNRQFGLCIKFLLFAMMLVGFADFADAQSEDNVPDSSSPVLISEPNSTKVLTADPSTWRGILTKRKQESYAPGSRVVVYVTNINLLPDEDENAFRAYAEDADGLKYRLIVEGIQKVRRYDWVYGVTIRIFDPTGYNDQPPPGEILLRVSWRGNTSNQLRLSLGNEGKSVNATGLYPAPFPAQPFTESARYEPSGDRKRFMQQAAFGPSKSLDLRLRQIGLRRWIEEQFAEPYPTIPYPNFAQKPFDGDLGCGVYGSSPEVNLCHRNHYWSYNNQNWMFKEALYGEDQLRRRTSWALHQIWVVSTNTVYQQRWLQEYIEILDRNAFGNYRDLMSEMTLSPAMGEYLDMVRSTKNNPNENYPRELLQLFSIGLYKLNQDGTFVLDGQGNRIPTYDQEKINQFTKVFTGWSLCNSGSNSACANAVVGAPNFIDPMYMNFPGDHDTTAKTLFDYAGAPNPTIAACSNCTTDAARRVYATDSLNKTLDNIFYHPNVAPFVSKILIQQFVTGDPTPAYVARVAAKFNDNGAGVRGDMKAVIRAILLDPEARGSRKTEPTYGKLREPLQFLTNFLRNFDVRASTPMTVNGVQTPPPTFCGGKSDGVLSWVTGKMGQEIWAPPTVFSYYAPDSVIPGTQVLGPEFALANTSTAFARTNQMMGYSFQWNWFTPATAQEPYPWTPCGTSIDITEAQNWAAADTTGNTLIEGLNLKMMHGTMSEAMKSKIRAAINFNVSARDKAQQAIFLTASSSQYQIQK